MKELMVFTWKRLVCSKKFFLIEFLLILIGISGAILCEVYFAPISDPRIGVLGLFQSYTQFIFLVFAFIFVQQFAQDIQDGSVVLFEYLGFSRRSLVMAKISVLLLVFLLSIDSMVLFGAFLYHCSDYAYIGATLLLLDLGIVGMVVCAAVLACLIKKTSTATLAFYGVYLASNLLNLFCYGMTNQADLNSMATYVLAHWIGLSGNHPTLKNFVYHNDIMLAVVVSSAWITLLLIVALFTQRKRVKK